MCCTDVAALRSSLAVRVRHISSQHPDAEVRKQATKIMAEPTAAGFEELWMKLRLYGPVLLIDEVLINAGLQVAAPAWEGASDVDPD